MKDQYFGDVNDFRKYGLLRTIAASGLSLGVCWMLTESERDAHDGKFLAYLDKPEKFRHFDPELFDWLRQVVGVEKDRRVAWIEGSKLLRPATFYSKALRDGQCDRKAYFDECATHFAGCDLVFFDPDNGLERSIPRGRKNSCKYLYWDELCSAFERGSSVMVYQHFARKRRDAYLVELTDKLWQRANASAVVSFRTPHVLFLLAAQERHAVALRELFDRVNGCWDRQIVPQQHPLTAQAPLPSP